MDTNVDIREMIGRNLQDFKIVEMTEVCTLLAEDGRISGSLGFFKNSVTAEGFIATRANPAYLKAVPALVLTDGFVGYLIEKRQPMRIFDEEVERREIKEKALAKLSSAEREILGLPEL